MPHQEVQAYLSGIPGSDRTRAAAWDAVYNVPDDAQAEQVLRSLPYSDEVKATLWDYRAKAGSEQATQPEGSAIGRFTSGVASQLNPLTLAEGLYNTVRHPVTTAQNILGASVEQGRQALEHATQPGLLNKVEAVGHAAAVLPLIGPQAAQAGEQIASGDVAGGLGKGAGMLAPFAAQKAIELRTAAKASKAAPILTRQASEQVSQRVLAPGNPAYKGKAAAIAPQVLERGLRGSRDELRQIAVEGMSDAGAKLDDAIQAAGGAQAPVHIGEVVKILKDKINDLRDSTGQPLSSDAAIKIKALDDKILQLQATGGKQGVATFQDMRKIRDENYGLAEQARAYQRLGNPVKDIEGWAGRETGSAIREVFAKRSPESAAANADYTFFKTLNDVLDPVLGRPKATAAPTGVTGGMRTSGSVAGNLIGGKAGAFIFGTVVPWVRDRLNSPEWQLADAHSKLKLAAAMKSGDIGAMRSAMLKIQESQAGPATTSSQTATAPGVP